MIKKTIEFENFNGEKEKEDFYFNLSKGELVQMQMRAIDQKTESFQDKLEQIGKTLNGRALIDVIDEIVLTSFGKKSTDGKRFEKSDALSQEFKSTGAYSELIVELCTDSEKTAEFVNGLMPASLREAVKKEVAESNKTARERSEALLQGHKEKSAPTIQKQPELPTEIVGTADPVLEPLHVPVEQTEELAKFREWQESQKTAKVEG